MKAFRLVVVGTFAVVVACASVRAADFDGLGDLDDGGTFSQAFAVSNDGAVVVGRSSSSNGTEAFRWVDGTGIVGLGDLSGGIFSSEAFGVSADGTVVVGKSISGNGTEAFRWLSGGGMTGLSDLTGGTFHSEAFAVCDDGNTVVGKGTSADGTEAFRWVSGSGMSGLDDLSGGVFLSWATGVSADGTIVVGISSSTYGFEAFKYNSSTSTMTGLGDLPGGAFMSMAEAVSMVYPVPDNDSGADGRVIVGSGTSGGGTKAMYYKNGMMRSLGDFGGGETKSVAKGVSEDGSIVVGYGTDASGRKAFIWDVDNGYRDLKTVLEDEYGLNLTGWTLTEATAISPDGRVIVGFGQNSSSNTEAWRAVIGRGDIEPDQTKPRMHHWEDEWSDAMSFVVLDSGKVKFQIIKYVWVEDGFNRAHCHTGSANGDKVYVEHAHFEHDVDTTKANDFWDWYYNVGTSGVTRDDQDPTKDATNDIESIAYAMDGYATNANYDYWLIHGDGDNQANKVFSEDCDLNFSSVQVDDRLAYDEGEDQNDGVYDHVTIVDTRFNLGCSMYVPDEIRWKCGYSGVYEFDTTGASDRWATPGMINTSYIEDQDPNGTYDDDYWDGPDIFRKK